MVVFTCLHCNSSVTKQKVENHFKKCQKVPYLTCVDCLKDFHGYEAYISHTSCVTENERYGGASYVPNKQDVKRNTWLDCVRQALELYRGKISKDKLKLLEKCSQHSAVPRQKKKFLNLVRNNFHFKSETDATEVFEMIEAEYKKKTVNNNNQTDSKENQESNNLKKIANGKTESNKSKKRKNRTSESSDGFDDVNHFISQISKKNKKKKLVKSNNIINEEEEEGSKVEIYSDNVDDEMRIKKKKNKNKQKQDETTSTETSENSVTKTEEGYSKYVKRMERMSISEDNENETESADVIKLTKKERKKLMKQDKYKTELNDVQNCESDQLNTEGKEKEEKLKKGKSKKIKAKKGTETEEPEIEKIDNKLPDEMDNEEQTYEDPSKFRWEQVITKVLISANDEMPMKRLTKKVLTEYQVITGQAADDVVANKFLKKIYKMPRVKIFKDKAQLC